MLTIDDDAKVAAAIRAAEARTDGEIQAIVSPSSDAYHDTVFQWALAVALLPLALSAAFPHMLVGGVEALFGTWGEEPTLRTLLTCLLVATILLFLIARCLFGLPRLRFALTPDATKAQRVRLKAVQLFKAGTEARTATATGVLLYLSLAEHRAEIVADAAINAKVTPETWGDAMAALIDAVKDGRPGDGMVASVGKIGQVLSEHFPRSPDDTNELPDRLILL
jgi:putative membrane protein